MVKRDRALGEFRSSTYGESRGLALLNTREFGSHHGGGLRRAFTLLELLIVLGVAAVLVGLLLPAIGLVRRGGRGAACASNVHQLLLANHSYSLDFVDRVAPGAANHASNLERWHGRRGSTQEPFMPAGAPLSQYLGPGGAVRRCPAFKEDSSLPGIDFEAGAGGYGYNNAYVGIDPAAPQERRDLAGVRMARVSNPALTVMFTDTAFALRHPGQRVVEYSFAEPPRHPDDPAWPMDPSIHFRHDGIAYVGWVDGHVDEQTFAFTRGNIYGIADNVMRGLDLGWFGPEHNGLFDLK